MVVLRIAVLLVSFYTIALMLSRHATYLMPLCNCQCRFECSKMWQARSSLMNYENLFNPMHITGKATF